MKKIVKLTESQFKQIIENTIKEQDDVERQITGDEVEFFNYLNELRQSGETNMFGATPYLENAFGLSKQDARKVLGLWMKNFNENGYSRDTLIKEK